MTSVTSLITENGFLPDCFDLECGDIVPALLEDTAVFDGALEEFERRGEHRVPYLITDSIRTIAHDPAIVSLVESILGTGHWVMWGSNIRRSVANESNLWHVDLESVLWSSLTVAIGLDKCDERGATWFIPGTQSIGKGPRNWVSDCGSTDDVYAKAKKLNTQCGAPQQVSGFRGKRFYMFDGRCWHKADSTGSAGKVVLYMHYQRATEKRIPLMLDYTKCQWSSEACPYIASAPGTIVNQRVHWPPLRQWIMGALFQRLMRPR